MEFLKRTLLIISICLAIALAVYYSGGHSAWTKFWEGFAPEIGGSLISFMFGYLIWGWIEKKERVQENLESKIILDHLLKSNKALLEKIEYLEQRANINHNLFNIVKKQDEKVKNLVLHYSKAPVFTGRFYSKIMASYHDSFSILSNGFHIKNEYLSLNAYVQFWNYMVLAQKERESFGEPQLIARIVHSNSIHIWTNEHSKYKEFTNKLLNLQKEFVEANGVVVRIFIGNDDIPNKDYLIALAKMKEHLIEAKYLKQSEFHKLPYDFLLLHDESFVLKWYSDASGNSLAGTLIQDFAESEIKEKWEDLYNELTKKGDAITSIPNEREFKVRKKTI